MSKILVGLRQWSKESRKKKVIKTLRESFALFGYPLDELGDEEIEKGVQELCRKMSDFGLTAEEALEVFNKINN